MFKRTRNEAVLQNISNNQDDNRSKRRCDGAPFNAVPPVGPGKENVPSPYQVSAGPHHAKMPGWGCIPRPLPADRHTARATKSSYDGQTQQLLPTLADMLLNPHAISKRPNKAPLISFLKKAIDSIPFKGDLWLSHQGLDLTKFIKATTTFLELCDHLNGLGWAADRLLLARQLWAAFPDRFWPRPTELLPWCPSEDPSAFLPMSAADFPTQHASGLKRYGPSAIAPGSRHDSLQTLPHPGHQINASTTCPLVIPEPPSNFAVPRPVQPQVPTAQSRHGTIAALPLPYTPAATRPATSSIPPSRTSAWPSQSLHGSSVAEKTYLTTTPTTPLRMASGLEVSTVGQVASRVTSDAQRTVTAQRMTTTQPSTACPPLASAAQQVRVPEGRPPATGARAIEPELCREQADLVELIVSGRNVFYTGSAGCGKSTVLKAFVRRLREIGKAVDIVAPTGRAALDINGSTTWTYAGWTPNHHKKTLEELKKNAHMKFTHRRLAKTNVLVIDEISMVENHHFERLNAIMKEARGNHRPFGAVQLVVTGDFCQLPPVKAFQYCMHCGRELMPTVPDTTYRCSKHGDFQDIDKWAFRSSAWKEARFQHVNLTTVHRQTDKVFIGILNKCRYGVPLTAWDEDLLVNHASNTHHAIRLFATREEVSRLNNAEFAKPSTRRLTFTCVDTFVHNPQHRHLEFKKQRIPSDGSLEALRDHRYDTTIELKKGMLVVLLTNLSIGEGLVNGSQGVIVGFKSHEASDIPKPVDRNVDGKARPSNFEFPKLSGEYAHMREGQIKMFIERAAIKEWPIVRFANGVKRPIIAECTVNELGDEQPRSLLSRTQIPLAAAWAMTVHKSQGMTLDRVIVNLEKSFEEGQMYVALSRARSLDGLKVEGLGKWQGGGNAQVKEFLRINFGIT